ncbi:acyltransferase [Patescibacteria group bacterium]|nr:acyltransferase [Patescibacteria group bacterium]
MQDKNGHQIPLSQLPQKISRRLSTIFSEFWLLVLRFVGFIPLHSVRKFFYILSGIDMPWWSSTIHLCANFFQPSGIKIGHDTIVGDNAFLDGRGNLSIGSHVDIASQVLIYTNQHDIHSPDFGNQFGPVVIADYVFVGSRAIILPHVSIGKGAVIAAGAVVTKNVPEGEVWAGIPAQKIADRKLKTFSYRLGRPMLFQ